MRIDEGRPVGLIGFGSLPYGYRCKFLYDGESGAMHVYWYPDEPPLPDWTDKRRRRFLAAYTRHRDAFIARLAEQINGSVLIAEVGNRNEVVPTKVISPNGDVEIRGLK